MGSVWGIGPGSHVGAGVLPWRVSAMGGRGFQRFDQHGPTSRRANLSAGLDASIAGVDPPLPEADFGA